MTRLSANAHHDKVHGSIQYSVVPLKYVCTCGVYGYVPSLSEEYTTG